MFFRLLLISLILWVGHSQGMENTSKWTNFFSYFNSIYSYFVPTKYVELVKAPISPKKSLREIEELAKRENIEKVVEIIGKETFVDPSQELSPTAVHLAKNLDSLLKENKYLQRFNQKKALLGILDSVVQKERELNS